MNRIVRACLFLGVFILILAALVSIPPPGRAGLVASFTNSTTAVTAINSIIREETSCLLFGYLCSTDTMTEASTTITSQVHAEPAVVFVGPGFAEWVAYVSVAKAAATIIVLAFTKLGQKSKVLALAFNPTIDGGLFLVSALVFLSLSNVYMGFTLFFLGVSLITFGRFRGRRKSPLRYF